jgi:uncharacterized protein
MKINIAQVDKAIGERQSFSFLVPVHALAGDQELWLRGQVEVAGEVVNNGRSLRVTGTISAESAGVCNRCLSEFASPVTIPFAEDFQKAGQTTAEGDLTVYSGEEIDLSELIREAVILAEPLKALCSQDCKGLCPKCGVNLNQTTCSCDRFTVDPRLAALEKLLHKK